MEIQKFKIQRIKKKKKISKSKFVLPKIPARSGLVGKNPPGPISCHFKQFFPWAAQIPKMFKNCIFSLMGRWALFTRFGPLPLSTRGGEIEKLLPKSPGCGEAHCSSHCKCKQDCNQMPRSCQQPSHIRCRILV